MDHRIDYGVDGLQACLPSKFTQRGLDHLIALLAQVGLDLEEITSEGLNRMGSQDPFVFLDAGCGAGYLAEEFARRMSLQMHVRGFKPKIQTLGLDLSPIPGERFKSWSTRFITGDLTTMKPLPTASVNLGASIRALQYTDDHLAAIASGWRVLRPGGTMIWDLSKEALTEPGLEVILDKTQNGRSIFELIDTSATSALLICMKRDEYEFSGFPFVKVGNTGHKNNAPDKPYRQFMKTTHYRPL